MMRFPGHIASLLIPFVFVAGCAGAGGLPGSPGPATTLPQTRSIQQTTARNAGLPERLFVANLSNSVSVYAASSNSPLSGITAGLTRVTNVYVDASGTLYVSNQGYRSDILEYKAGSSRPFKTLTKGFSVPGFIAVGTDGTMYVSDKQNGSIVVRVFRKGADLPNRTIVIPDAGYAVSCGGLTFDPSGDLIVGTFLPKTQTSHVFSIAPGSSRAQDLHLAELPGSQIAADAAGNIYVAGESGDIAVYAPNDQWPVRHMITSLNDQVYGGIAALPDGTLYVPSYTGGIYEFAPGASSGNVFSPLTQGNVDVAVGNW